MSHFDLEGAIRIMESCIENWEFMAKPYTDEECLDSFGTVKIDGEDVQITNSAMESVVKLIAAAQAVIVEADKANNNNYYEIRRLRQDLEKAHSYASMSDVVLAEELQKEITYFEVHDGEENLTYGPVQLMKYCRDRLRSRR